MLPTYLFRRDTATGRGCRPGTAAHADGLRGVPHELAHACRINFAGVRQRAFIAAVPFWAPSRFAGLYRLVEAVVDGRVDRVLVHRLDRLTRRAADWAAINNIFREHDVAISVVDGGIHGAADAITPFRLNALAVFAEFERDMIAERLRDARAARRARGLRVAGRLPLGFVADPATKQLVIVPAEAAIVRRMFADADAGMLPAAISAHAKAKRRVDKNGKTDSWNAKGVLRILRNATYAGLLRDGNAGVHPAIVDCRGSGCVKTQLPARAIEALVPQLFAKPAPGIDDETRIVFDYVARIWEHLIIPNRRSFLLSLCRELRWDAERSVLRIVADEEGVANWMEGWRRIHAEQAAELAAAREVPVIRADSGRPTPSRGAAARSPSRAGGRGALDAAR